jgi:two-component system sensor histidine kinase ComP
MPRRLVGDLTKSGCRGFQKPNAKSGWPCRFLGLKYPRSVRRNLAVFWWKVVYKMAAKKCFYTAATVVLIIAAYLITATLQYPFIGIDVVKNAMGEWQIAQIDQFSWAEQQDIRVGDVIRFVNERRAEDHPTIKHYGMLERADHFVLERDGQTFFYQVPAIPSDEQILTYTIIPTVLLFLMVGFSVFLLRKKPNDPIVCTLVLFLLAVGISYLSAVGSSRGYSYARIINGLATFSVPPLFLYFLHRYFRAYGLQVVHPRLLLHLGWISALPIVANIVFMLVPLGEWYPAVRFLKLVVITIGVLLCILTLLFAYRKHRKTRHAPIFKIMLIGIMLAFSPSIVLRALPQIIMTDEWIPGAFPSMFLFFLPITFIYLVSTNRLLDIDFVINRLRYYSILALIPSICVTLLLIVFHNDKHDLTDWVWNFSIIYANSIAFLYLKENLRYRLRSKLFTEKYNFQASLDQFSRDLSRIVKTTELEKRLIGEIKNVLDVREVSLIQVESIKRPLKLIQGYADFPAELIRNHIVGWTQACAIGEIVDIGKGILLCVGRKSGRCSMLWIGEKDNRTRYNLEEKVWLKTIAQYVSIIYENLSLIEGVTEEMKELMEKRSSYAPPWFLRFMFHLSEKERRRLALDLHDSVLQQQLYWYRRLENILNDRNIPPERTRELHEVKEGLLDVIHEIRDTCNQLQPPFLKEMGIVEALKNLFQQTQLRSNYVIEFDSADFQANLDHEQLIALYRIVQELLGNATKHSQASKIMINLASSNEKIFLFYQDNGIGMNLGDVLHSFKHIGLAGIKERVSSLEGETYFCSSPGQGLKVSISIPRFRTESKDEEKGKGERHDSSIVG